MSADSYNKVKRNPNFHMLVARRSRWAWGLATIILLMYFAFGAITFTLGAIFIPGMTGLYSLVGISLCMSVMFPTIYGIALEGVGEDAKFGAAFLVMAIVGGAIMPVLQGAILDFGGSGYTDIEILGVPEVNFSFVLPLICFFVVAIYGYRTYRIHSIKNQIWS